MKFLIIGLGSMGKRRARNLLALNYSNVFGYDISKFNHRDIPQTDALKYQKGYSLDPFESWLCEVGQRGYVYASEYGEEGMGWWYEQVSTELLMASLKQYCDEKRLTQYDRIGIQRKECVVGR